MNIYSFISFGYDLLDRIWLSEKGKNPRREIEKLISNEDIKILDMCCGTFSNGYDLAVKNPNIRFVGLDRSKEMLRVASKKLDKAGVKNVELVCADAANTDFNDGEFDVIIIGLVLHECNEELRKALLLEAKRLLKSDGRLIILEWERPRNRKQLIKYFPLYVLERLNCGAFDKFFKCDKGKYFRGYGLNMVKRIHCNYTVVCELRK